MKVFFIAARVDNAFALLLTFSLLRNTLSKVNKNNKSSKSCSIYPWVPRSAPGIGRRVEHLSSLWLTFSQLSSSEKSSQSDSPLQRSDLLIQRPGKTHSHSNRHTVCPLYAHTNGEHLHLKENIVFWVVVDETCLFLCRWSSLHSNLAPDTVRWLLDKPASPTVRQCTLCLQTVRVSPGVGNGSKAGLNMS